MFLVSRTQQGDLQTTQNTRAQKGNLICGAHTLAFSVHSVWTYHVILYPGVVHGWSLADSSLNSLRYSPSQIYPYRTAHTRSHYGVTLVSSCDLLACLDLRQLIAVLHLNKVIHFESSLVCFHDEICYLQLGNKPRL